MVRVQERWPWQRESLRPLYAEFALLALSTSQTLIEDNILLKFQKIIFICFSVKKYFRKKKYISLRKLSANDLAAIFSLRYHKAPTVRKDN